MFEPLAEVTKTTAGYRVTCRVTGCAWTATRPDVSGVMHAAHQHMQTRH